MMPRRIVGETAYLDKPDDWVEAVQGRCGRLAVRQMKTQQEGVFWYESAWEPTPDELVRLHNGGSVIVRVAGVQPPIVLYVEEHVEES